MSTLDEFVRAMIVAQIRNMVRPEALLDEPAQGDDAELMAKARAAAERMRARRGAAR